MNEQNFTNTLYTNDNLYILNGLNSNLVDLIYLDPPFNSKRMYSAPIGSKAAGASFKDIWTWDDVNEAYLETLAENFPALARFIGTLGRLHSKAMAAYLTYMTQRIIEMHRVLKDSGSLYLHCDPTASHYLKIVLDNVFGKNNFRNEITWKRQTAKKGSQYEKKTYGSSSDTIFWYSKTNNYTFNIPIVQLDDETLLKKFNRIDEAGRKFRTDNITLNRMMARSNLSFEYKGYTPKYGWMMNKEKLEQFDKENRLYWSSTGKPYRKYFLDEYDGQEVSNVWNDISVASGKESTSYPTQKPLKLLRRIIEASSNEGDIVLDPFCGCATTCVAAQQLNRKWIGIDIEPSAHLLMERLSDDSGLFKDFINFQKPPQRTDVIIVSPTKKEMREQLYKEQNKLCNGCGNEYLLKDFETDHIIPKAKGGGDYYENYQLLCGNCNRMKGSNTMEYLLMKIKVREKLLKEEIIFGR